MASYRFYRCPKGLFCIAGVNFCRRLWLKHLQRKFPDLEFVKRTSLRTAMDTIRNQGIVTVLLQVKGSCNVALFRQKIQVSLEIHSVLLKTQFPLTPFCKVFKVRSYSTKCFAHFLQLFFIF